MNLAICHPIVEPARGGCERYITALMHRLVRDGHTVHLYASRHSADALPPGVEVHAVPDRSRPRFLRPWRFSQACCDLLHQRGHDLSIGFDKVAGMDVLYPQGGLHEATVDHGLLRWRSPLARVLLAGLRCLDPSHLSFSAFEHRQYLAEPPPFIIVNSDFVRRHLQVYLGIEPDTVSVLHSAMDTERLIATDRPARRMATRDDWGAAPGDTLVLFIAMNYRLKGLEPLLCAVARMPQRERFRLIVVGDPNTRRYERIARRLRIADSVRFQGFMPNPRDAFFAADLLVHPTFYDPCSLVVCEAQACGLPVITTRTNGAAELLDPPVDGLVVNSPHDTQELADALTYFLDPARRQSAARAAMRASLRWGFEAHYRQLMRLLEDAVRRKRAA